MDQSTVRHPPGERERRERVPTGRMFAIGVAGAMIWSVLTLLADLAGLGPWSLELALGSMLTRQSSGMVTLAMGTVWHWINGGLFALLYGYAFASFLRTGARFGLYVAIIHYALAGFVLALFRESHPVQALFTEFRGRPNLWAGAPPMVTYGGLVLHLIYGMFVGAAHWKSTGQFRPLSAGVQAGPSEPPDQTFDPHTGPKGAGRPAEGGRKESA